MFNVFMTVLSIVMVALGVLRIIAVVSRRGEADVIRSEAMGFNPIGDAIGKTIICMIPFVVWLISMIIVICFR